MYFRGTLPMSLPLLNIIKCNLLGNLFGMGYLCIVINNNIKLVLINKI
nr:MAG TPA: hypothetical protein [Caudoviricetes sp.]